MKISVPRSNQEAVDAMNKKLGTSFTVFDYRAWEAGEDTEGAREFDKAVERYVGSAEYRVVRALAIAMHKVKHIFK